MITVGYRLVNDWANYGIDFKISRRLRLTEIPTASHNFYAIPDSVGFPTPLRILIGQGIGIRQCCPLGLQRYRIIVHQIIVLGGLS